MSRSQKKSKGPWYEFWSKRPGSNRGGCCPTKFGKKQTLRTERRQGKKDVK